MVLKPSQPLSLFSCMHPNLFSILSLSFLFPLSLDLHIVVTMVGRLGSLRRRTSIQVAWYLTFGVNLPSFHPCTNTSPHCCHHRHRYGILTLSSYNRCVLKMVSEYRKQPTHGPSVAVMEGRDPCYPANNHRLMGNPSVHRKARSH